MRSILLFRYLLAFFVLLPEQDFDELVDGGDAAVRGVGVGGGLRAKCAGAFESPGEFDCCLSVIAGLEGVDVWGRLWLVLGLLWVSEDNLQVMVTSSPALIVRAA